MCYNIDVDNHNHNGEIMKQRFYGFTLAEMMVVMLILSIVLAAFAPVMTTRQKRDISSPWKYSDNQSDAYFGLGNEQRAMIGQKNRPISGTADPDNRLTIQTSRDTQSHILFKDSGNNISGKLFMGNNSVILGTGSVQGDANTSLGYHSLYSNTSGDYIVSVGTRALYKNTTGRFNTALGSYALSTNETSSFNTAVGYQALQDSTSESNTAVGFSALSENTTGSSNTGIGSRALLNNTTASSNTALGSQAMTFNTTGDLNTALGANAMRSNTTGVRNVAIGSQSLNLNETGSYNVAVGESALNKSVSTNNNVAVGFSALYSNTTGDSNTGVGNDVMFANTTGFCNTAVGFLALFSNKEGYHNTAIGTNALTSSTGNDNTSVGSYSMYSKNTGNYNVAFGRNTLYHNTSGFNNTALGTSALFNNTTGQSNVVIGRSGAYTNTSGSENIAIGGEYTANGTGTGTKYGTLGSNKTGDHNIAIGVGALPRSTGNNNIAIGAMACENVTSATNKICIGNHSGPKSENQYGANDSIERVFIGSQSKYNGGTAVLEVHNTSQTASFRHYDALPNNATSVVINGNLLLRGRLVMQPEVYYKNYVYDMCTMTMTSGDSNDYAYYRYCGSESNAIYNVLSDKRLKYLGPENTSGLDKIQQLKVYNYTFKKDKKKIPHVGVIAQDLQKVFPDAVTKGKDGFLRIRIEDIFFSLVNSVKELANKVNLHDKKIKQLEQENKELKEIVKRVQSDNRTLETRLEKLELKIK